MSSGLHPQMYRVQYPALEAYWSHCAYHIPPFYTRGKMCLHEHLSAILCEICSTWKGHSLSEKTFENIDRMSQCVLYVFPDKFFFFFWCSFKRSQGGPEGLATQVWLCCHEQRCFGEFASAGSEPHSCMWNEVHRTHSFTFYCSATVAVAKGAAAVACRRFLARRAVTPRRAGDRMKTKV